MISHLQMVTVWVTDLARAVAFYTGPLGFKRYADWDGGPGDRIVWVCPEPALPLGLATGIGLAEAPANDPRVGRSNGLVFSAPDIEAAYRALRERGVPFSLELRHPPGEPPDEREARFSDPDGNEFLLHS